MGDSMTESGAKEPQPLELLTLTEQQKEFAAAYLNETEERRERFVPEIRAWIQENDDLCSRTDDFFILRFLRGCKFNVDEAKRKIRRYYEQRALSPEWFSNRDPFLPEIQELLDIGVFLPLKQVDSEGRLVVVIRTCAHDPKRHRQSDVLKTSMMLLDLAARDHVSGSIYGIVAIHDMQGVQFGHALQMTPTIIKRLVNTWYGYPNRVRSLDYVHAPMHVNLVLNVFKQFMSKKLRERVHVHRNNGRDILRKISPAILPPELGGTGDNYQSLQKYWKQQAEENKQWFLEDETYKLKT